VKKNILRNALTALLCFVLIGASQASVLAATAATSNSISNNTNTLKVSPLRTDLTVPPGTSAKVSAVVTNLTNKAFAVQPIENDFIAGASENGVPSIILNQNQYAPTHSLKRFMGPLPTYVTVPANGSAQVNLTISVPKNAQAGGYFGAIRFAPPQTNGSQSVNLSASIASLILMIVPGPTIESVDLTNFDVQQDGANGTNFRTPKDLSVLVRFQNKGNLQESPFGQIYVEKGKKTVYTYNFNQTNPKGTILPDSARRWNIPLHGFGKFGKYTVGAALTYGVNKSQTIDLTKTIWIIPTTLIFAVVGGFVLLILIIVLIWLFLRSYKRRILGSNTRRFR
jgi:hypothetical protein